MVGRRERRAGSWRRRFTAGLCAVAAATQFACHSYLPPQSVIPANGKEVAVELNDRGRVLVGDRLGESVVRVEGKLLGSTDSAVTLSVSRLVMLQGSSALWVGEQVDIPVEGVRSFRLREFSRGRSVMMTVAVVAGIAIFGGILSVVGGGIGRPPGGGGCTTNCGEQ